MSRGQTVDAALRGPAKGASRVFILLSGALTYGAAGLANSVISRVSILSQAGYSVSLLVDVWQRDLGMHVKRLKENGRLGDQVEVRNIYDDLQNHASAPSKVVSYPAATPHVDQYVGDLRSNGDDRNPLVVRFYRDEEYRYFGFKRDSKTIDFLDELVAGERKRRLFFETDGRLAKVVEYNRGDQVREEYFNGNGLVYLKRVLGDNISAVNDVNLMGSTGSYIRLSGDGDLLRYWLLECFDLKRTDVIISEYAFRMEPLEQVKAVTGVPVVYTLHNSHLAAPFDIHSPVKPELEQTFVNAHKMSALVVLTPQQRLDIQKRWPLIDNLHVIPHAGPALEQHDSEASDYREPGLVVLVGRLSDIKGQKRVVEQFESVIERVEHARLEIWGRGPDEAALEALIADRGLGDRVRVCGFTLDPRSVYRRAEVALFPSKHEGQPLSLMEAMQEGSVPVCFDFKYGARLMVDDMVNGVIVERGDMQDLLDSAVVLLQNPDLTASMSLKAIEKISEFSPERLVRDWSELFANLHDGAI